MRAKATSRAPYSWLTVQITPMTPMIEVSAAPAAIVSSDWWIRSSSGGKALAIASATCVRTAGSLREPARDPEHEEQRRDGREQRREGQSVREQTAGGAP